MNSDIYLPSLKHLTCKYEDICTLVLVAELESGCTDSALHTLLCLSDAAALSTNESAELVHNRLTNQEPCLKLLTNESAELVQQADQSGTLSQVVDQ